MHSGLHISTALAVGLAAIAIGLNHRRFEDFRIGLTNLAMRLHYWPFPPPRSRVFRATRDFHWFDWVAGQAMVALGVLLAMLSVAAILFDH